MTKQKMLYYIQESLKWAMENDSIALEKMQCVFLGEGFKTVTSWKYSATKKFTRLNKDDLLQLMLKIVECMY